MRCRSFRAVLYLVVGLFFGIVISSFLQIFALFPSASLDYYAGGPPTVHAAEKRVADLLSYSFEETRELKIKSSETDGKSLDTNQDQSEDYPADERLDLVQVEESDHHEAELLQEEMQKKQLYMEQNRQGRNMQDVHAESSQNPVAKLSDELATRKPLLIAVITSVQQLMSQTIAVHGTWAKKESTILYFVGDVQSMPHLPHGMELIQLEGVDDKQATWEVKEMAVFKYLIAHYSEHVDWYLVVGDDTYVKADSLRRKLVEFNSNVNVYMGTRKTEPDVVTQCNPSAGIVYSKGLVSRLEQYLPQCIGEGQNIGDCINQRGIRCTRAQETRDLFYIDHGRILETPLLYTSKKIINRALTLSPIRYAKFMYRLYSYLQEIRFNVSTNDISNAMEEIELTHPFVPTHLRSSFKPSKNSASCSNKNEESHETMTEKLSSHLSLKNVNVRPRYKPKNKFEINAWDYFNQTRLMSINSEQPSHGIIGGIREEARFVMTKGISIANHGLPLNEKLIFDKLENGYHRVDPMRGSEYILDFVFRKTFDKSTRVRKRITLLRPFHETIVPIDTLQDQPRINFIVTLSGLSERLEKFLETFEKNVLIPKEDASLTIILYNSPDAQKVHNLIEKYTNLYPQALLSVKDIDGVFARGVGLHHGTEYFKDNELMFFVDIDLEIGPDFIRRARMNVVQRKQVYFPIFFKLYKLDFVRKYHKGNSTQLLSRHNGHWAHYSYGMVVIYASDYRKVGGFDTNIKGWGEEDVDFFKKVISHGLEVFRAPDPGLIHLWHPKICNKNTVATQEAYYHCLQSKSENLADRVELARYIFQEASDIL